MKCSEKDCKNVAIVYPKFLLRPKGYYGEPAGSILRIPLCSDCKKTITKKDFFAGDGWKQIEKIFSTLQKEKPHPDNSDIIFVDIEEYEKIFKKGEKK